MKKFTIIAVAALALAMTSCDEFTMPNPPAQSNEQEAIFVTSDLTVEDLLNGKLDLGAYGEGVNPQVLKYSATNVPSDRVVKFVMEISDTEDFAKVAEVSTRHEGEDIIAVSAYDVQQAYSATFSREPKAANVYVRYKAYISNQSGTENIRIGGPNVYYCESQIVFTPVLLSHVVEESYYLVTSAGGFKLDSALPLIKSNEGNPYDEPDFYLPIQVSGEQAEAGFYWAIIPGSSYAAGTLENGFGASPNNVNNPLLGTLVQGASLQEVAGQIPAAGSYMLKVNMYDLTYSISLAYEFLYVNAQGYYPQFEKMLRLSTTDFVNYGGVVRTSGTFRLYCQPKAEGTFYSSAEGTEAETKDGVTTGELQSYTSVPTEAMKVPHNSFYYVKANIKDMTWSAAEIENISIVGSFNGWNEKDPSTTMTPDRYKVVYTYNGIVLDAGGEFKFNCNKAWTLSFGGSVDAIVENGGNIKVDEIGGAGTYDITLNFTTIPYSVTCVKK